MSDVEDFLAEQQEHMEMPDEDFNVYLSRRGHSRRTQVEIKFGDNTRPSATPAKAKQTVFDRGEPHANQDANMSLTGAEHGLGQMSRAKRKSPEAVLGVFTSAPKKPKTRHSEERLIHEVEVNPHSDSVAQPSAESRVTAKTTGRSRDVAAHRMDFVAVPSHPQLDAPPPAPETTSPDIGPLSTASPVLGREHEGHANFARTFAPSSSNPCTSSADDRQLRYPSGSGLLVPAARDDMGPGVEKKVSNHTATNAGRGGKVLKIAKKDVAPSRGADSSNVTTPPSTNHPVASTSATKDTLVQAVKSAKQKVAPKGKAKAKTKDKERFTPAEYAQRLQTKFSEAYFAKKHPDKLFLSGKTLFYYGADHRYAREQTMRRMDIIVKAGGILLPTFDPERITHIVTDEGPRGLCEEIGLRSLSEIPDHIPTVKWSWVVSGMRDGPRKPAISGKGIATTGEAVDGAKDKAVQEEVKEAPRRLAYEFLHASFAARVDAGPQPWASSKGPQNRPSNAQGDRANSGKHTGRGGNESRSESSGVSEFTQEQALPSDPVTGGQHARPCAPLPPRDTSITAQPTSSLHGAPDSATHLVTADDPLAEFYDLARAERDAELEKAWNSTHESEDRIGIALNATLASKLEALGKRTFACDIVGGRKPSHCPNQDVIDKLGELRQIHEVNATTQDHWRVITYNRAIAALKSYPKRIRSIEEAEAIKTIGHRTASKIMEIIETGDLQRIKYERTPLVTALMTFIDVYGAGPHTARKWYAAGCRDLEDVKNGKGGIKLSPAQKIGLKHCADLQTRMPRSEAADIFNLIKPIALSIDPELFIEIMGSYRRGSADCGDIDILITRRTDDGKTHRGILKRLLGELHRQGIVTEDLSVPNDFDDLELVYRGLCRKQPGSPQRRIDFLTVPYQSRGAALLYYTGDDMFNRSMRLKANMMGYSLNQRGLYDGVVRDPRNRTVKLNTGHIIASETEREIFDILGVPWQEPHQRVRG